jgi:hypothetical protein
MTDTSLLQEKLDRAKVLLQTVRHAAMATVNEDGFPHNTPYFFACDELLERLYWGSHPESQHSKNVARTGQIFVVLYDAFMSGGLYIRADSAHISKDEELETAFAVFNARRVAAGKELESLDCYQGGSPQRMYVAKTRQFWVNVSDRDANGIRIRDLRHEVSRKDLIS